MFKAKSAFSGFSVREVAKAKAFYTEILGLNINEDQMGFAIHLPGGVKVFVYQKDEHTPATFTILNFVVDNIDAAIDELIKKGVTFEHYKNPDLPQDKKGVLRGLSSKMGPDIAWFKDPSGNVLSVLQEK